MQFFFQITDDASRDPIDVSPTKVTGQCAIIIKVPPLENPKDTEFAVKVKFPFIIATLAKLD